MISFSWGFSILIILIENSNRKTHNWIIKLWWIFCFIISSIRLQTIFIELEQREWDWIDLIYFMRLLIYGMIAFFGVFLSKNNFGSQIDEGLEYQKLDTQIIENNNYGSMINEQKEIKKSNRSPEEKAGIFSKITFQWVSDLLKTGSKRPIVREDIWDLIKEDESEKISQDFQKIWNEEKKKENPSIFITFAKQFGGLIFFSGFFELAYDGIIFTGLKNFFFFFFF